MPCLNGKTIPCLTELLAPDKLTARLAVLPGEQACITQQTIVPGTVPVDLSDAIKPDCEMVNAAEKHRKEGATNCMAHLQEH